MLTQKFSILLIFLITLIQFQKSQKRDKESGVPIRDEKKTKEFRLLDDNSDNYLDPEEIRKGFSDWTEKEVSDFFNFTDTNRDGVISLEEYLLTPMSN